MFGLLYVEKSKREEVRSINYYNIHEIFGDDNEWAGNFLEPNPYHIAWLSQFLREESNQGNIHKERYEIYQGCLAVTETSFIPLYCKHSFLMLDYRSSIVRRQKGPHILVAAFTLDSFLESTDLTPDLIRMDIQWAEEDIFKDYSFNYRPRMFIVEYHKSRVIGGDDTSKVVIEALSKNDYEIVDHKVGVPDLEIVAVDKRR